MAADRQAKEKLIVKVLGKGNTRRAAIAHAHISTATFYRWLEDEAFLNAVEKAEADAEIEHLDVIHRAARDGTWQAAAWILERHPRTKQDWKRIDELDLRKLSTDQLLALAAACDERVESAGDRMATAAGERQAAD